jgi:hypothetical protein
MSTPTHAAGPAPADDDQRNDQELLAQLRIALSTCSQLLEDLQAGRIDPESFRSQAFGAGLIVRDGEAWIWDFAEGWYRYDGIAVKHLPLPAESVQR